MKYLAGLLLVLTGCGGGGSSDSDPDPGANAAPVIDDVQINVNEDAVDLLELEATDGDGDSLTFVIDSGDTTLFSLSPTGRLRVREGQSLNFAVLANHELTVRVSDPAGASDTALVAIRVLDPGRPFGLTRRPPALAHQFPVRAPVQSALQLERVHGGLDSPVYFAQIPGTDLHLVAQQGGTILWFEPDELSAGGTFMTVPDPLATASEEGLLGFAFDPGFTRNGYFYLHYTQRFATGDDCVNELARRHSACSVVARFQLQRDGDGNFIATRGDPDSKQTVITQRQPFANHNGGMIAFGADGFLYIALGDGGSGGDPDGYARERNNLLGSVLRLDVDSLPYRIPPDNPFAGNDQGWREEIWAFGLRNPWRFSFDAPTGRLWLGDVGQRNWEEVDLIVAGGNYGWDFFEGNHDFEDVDNAPADVIWPVVEYSHDEGFSITGGAVYRGSRLPDWRGWYFYGDFVSRKLWALNTETLEGDVENVEVMDTGVSISAFGTDTAGELYLVDYGGNTGGGGIWRLVESTDQSNGQLPGRLSETGLFTELAGLTPAPGLIPYTVNGPFWSDGAVKTRWFSLPGVSTIGFSDTGNWTFPVGSVLVKQFDMPLVDNDPTSLRRLETRVFVHHDNGWAGYTYRWNSEQTEALLINDGESEELSIRDNSGGVRLQRYTYPGRSLCLSCHNDVAGAVLGLRTPQLNGDFDYGAAVDNQLRTLDFIGLFDRALAASEQYPAYPDPRDESTELTRRARAYLAINCAVCHRPDGPAPTAMDLRFDTPLAAMNILDVVPAAGDLGIADARLIAPGERARSLLWERLRRTDASRMPPRVSHRVDAVAVSLIGEWIDGL
ncbi:hypothetical protein FKG94_24375 [Exilibacterium tricleocarpae]|uniref:Cadherin domain-containing protein n=1 Tax=Exilibacterium tricleocarpae TaxID=2591008 RepID=A0A545SSM5_9GAMM|nr:PQQ-dependent sugar dehydrogenase [Exilibacterium tricleocarpae]TQV67974.1 hypothetical protein FKG94_24375 [Exilibacterium tricleocarpae]